MVLISIIMSVHNEEQYLDKTIKSVINQSYKNFEFIIIDDGSNKNVKKKLKEYIKKDKRIILITNKKNIGLTKSLNKGITNSKGNYIARIDNGDLCSKNRLKYQKEFLDNHLDCGIVGSFVNLIDTKGEKIGTVTYPTSNKKIQKGIIRTNLFAHSTLMIREKAIEDLGSYNEKWYYAQDYELILRIGSKYELKNINKYLVDYLYDSSGITASSKTRKKQDKYALKARYFALTKYGYSKKYFLQFILALIETIIPFRIKLFLVKEMKKKNINIKGKKIKMNK